MFLKTLKKCSFFTHFRPKNKKFQHFPFESGAGTSSIGKFTSSYPWTGILFLKTRPKVPTISHNGPASLLESPYPAPKSTQKPEKSATHHILMIPANLFSFIDKRGAESAPDAHFSSFLSHFWPKNKKMATLPARIWSWDVFHRKIHILLPLVRDPIS